MKERIEPCLIVVAATASYFPEFKRVALAMITAQGGIVGCCAAAPEPLAALPDGG